MGSIYVRKPEWVYVWLDMHLVLTYTGNHADWLNLHAFLEIVLRAWGVPTGIITPSSDALGRLPRSYTRLCCNSRRVSDT